jgi:hypothetical protein
LGQVTGTTPRGPLPVTLPPVSAPGDYPPGIPRTGSVDSDSAP